MLLSYLKLSLRLLARNPFFTFINVAGLSVGFAVFFILWQYSQNELVSDQFHKDADRIAMIIARIKKSSGTTMDESDYSNLPPALGYTVQKSVPELEDVTRIIRQNVFSYADTPGHGDKIFFSYESKTQVKRSFTEDGVIYADPNLFRFFTLPLEYGSPESVLLEPNSIVISSTIAKKYFGADYPIGKILYLNDSIPFQISGVFRPLPRNTHLSFNIVLSTNRFSPEIINGVGNLHLSTFLYVKRRSEATIEEATTKVDQIFQQEFISQWLKVIPSMEGKIWLSPLKDIAFSIFSFVPKSKFLLMLLSVLSLVVLGMALVNYINLFISANGKRLKELATRKSVGANPLDVIKQFVMEAAVTNMISFFAAITLVQLVRKPMEIFFDFYVPDWGSISLSSILIMVVVLIITLVLTGVYPAIATIKRTTTTLFGNKQHGRNKKGVIAALTVLQYTFAVVLIVWIFMVSDQIEYLLHKDRGIKTSQVAIIDMPIYKTKSKSLSIDQFLQALGNLTGVEDYSVSRTLVGDWKLGWTEIKRSANDPLFGVRTTGGVDERLIPFYGIRLITGRNFLPESPANHESIIISRIAMEKLGFASPTEAIGSRILIQPGDFILDKLISVEVIGVIEDYVRSPFFSNELGTVLTYRDYVNKDNYVGYVSVRVNPDKFSENISALNQAFDTYFPGEIFNWYFLDERINRYYQLEKTSRNQILLFACLAIGIACLGLLGMISNTVVDKTKEIGIRKVLGAQLHQIARILLNSTVKQIILATIIGIPAAYYLTHQYLEKFSDRIMLQWWHFILPVAMLVVIMFITIASVLWKAAKSNPVEALKYE